MKILLAFLLGSAWAHPQKTIHLKIAAPGKSVRKTYPAGKDSRNKSVLILQESSCPKTESAEEFCEDHFFVLLGGENLDQSRHKALVEISHDGHGASMVGEDTVIVENNRLTHSISGGAGSRWDEEKTYQLSPAFLISEKGSSYYAADAEKSSSSSIDYSKAQSFQTVTLGDACVYESQGIPFIQKSMTQDELGKLDFSACSVSPVEKLKGESTSQVQMIFVGNKLIIDVNQPKFILEAKSWLATDHLELWLGEGQGPSEDDDCSKDKYQDPHLAQWAILLSDGKMIPAFGEALTQVKAKIIDLTGGKRIIVEVPRFIRLKSGRHFWFDPLETRVTLAMSHGDGKKQVALTGTSTLRMGQTASLGFAQSFNCEVKDSKVLPRLKSLDTPYEKPVSKIKDLTHSGEPLDLLFLADSFWTQSSKEKALIEYIKFTKAAMAKSPELLGLKDVFEKCSFCEELPKFLMTSEKTPGELVGTWKAETFDCAQGNPRQELKATPMNYEMKIDGDGSFSSTNANALSSLSVNGKLFFQGDRFFEDSKSGFQTDKNGVKTPVDYPGTLRRFKLAKGVLNTTALDPERSKGYCESGDLVWSWKKI